MTRTLVVLRLVCMWEPARELRECGACVPIPETELNGLEVYLSVGIFLNISK